MASKTCVSCLRTLRKQSRSIVQTRNIPSYNKSRAFTSTVSRCMELPPPNATTASSIPPVTPERAENRTTPLSTKPVDPHAFKLGRITETYTAYGSTQALYKGCAIQADYTVPQAGDSEAEVPKTEDGVDLGVGSTWWHTDLGLQPTFSTWSQVTMLHMYLLSARFRNFSTNPQPWQQHLLDHFSYDAENRMTIFHGMHASGTRNKYLKDLFVQWRGLLAAYDEGIARGDAVLAAAIWRNLFKADENVNVKGLALIVSYVRRTLKGLDELPDEELMKGAIGFASPKAEESVVKLRSAMLDLPFERASGTDLTGKKDE